MSERETPTVKENEGTVYDDPNRESLGLDPAWVEGTGGAGGAAEPKSLDEMTKDELLAEAERRNLDVDASLTKAQLRAAIDEDQ